MEGYVMSKEHDKIVSMLKSINFPEGKMSPEYTFTLEAVDVFYYKGNIGAADIKTQFVDGKGDGGIDYIYTDGDTLFLIQGKSSEKITVEDVNNAFTKIALTISKFKDRKTTELNEDVQLALANAYDELNEDKNIEFVLFTRAEFSEEDRLKIQALSHQKNFEEYTLAVYDKNDIELQQAIEEQGAALVPKGELLLLLGDDKSANKLSYGDGKGIIVNIRASSLKQLYRKWQKNGLFSYNLREHISQKNVDDAIEDTIKNDRDNFWYYNNGITIGCAYYDISGYKLILEDFSIINGAQTTTKIGKSNHINEKNDFALTCKVVTAGDSFNEEDFIGKISEASNSQKPIKPRDLKSNQREQRVMQNKAANNGKRCLAIEIKRGVRPKNYNSVDKWQRVSNDYIGQLIYACILQQPGAARSDKSSIFSSNSTYPRIYKRKHDYDTLYDLVRMGDVYDQFVKDLAESTDFDNNDAMEIFSMGRNAKLSVLASLCYLLKCRRGIIVDRNSDGVNKDNLDGLLVSDYPGDDLDDKLKKCYEFIVRQLTSVYNKHLSTMKFTSYSNFLKLDQNYRELVLTALDNLDTYDKEKIGSFMEVFDGEKLSV